MADLGDLQRAVDYALESVEQRVERVGRRLLRNWYAGCALAGVCADPGVTGAVDAAKFARNTADAMLAALAEPKP